MTERSDGAGTPMTPVPMARGSAGRSRRRRTRTRRVVQAVLAARIDAVARFIWASGRIRSDVVRRDAVVAEVEHALEALDADARRALA